MNVRTVAVHVSKSIHQIKIYQNRIGVPYRVRMQDKLLMVPGPGSADGRPSGKRIEEHIQVQAQHSESSAYYTRYGCTRYWFNFTVSSASVNVVTVSGCVPGSVFF